MQNFSFLCHPFWRTRDLGTHQEATSVFEESPSLELLTPAQWSQPLPYTKKQIPDVDYLSALIYLLNIHHIQHTIFSFFRLTLFLLFSSDLVWNGAWKTYIWTKNQVVITQWLAWRLATREVPGSNPGKGENLSISD